MKLDTDCMTLTRYLLLSSKKKDFDLVQLMISIQTAVKAISTAVRKAGIAQMRMGKFHISNYYDDDSHKIVSQANDAFINMIRSSFAACCMISAENEDIIYLNESKESKYIVCVDPLDGASNIDCLTSIGSIFTILQKATDKQVTLDDVLQSGRSIVASGYALYGSATIIVVSVGDGVHNFVLDPSIGEFLLIDRAMQIPNHGLIYSINEGYSKYWYEPIKNFIQSLKDTQDSKPYAGRYIGSMVADVHRTLKYGGIFMYPSTKDCPKGKLRILYECFPMAYLMEQAGGSATTGSKAILDLQPEGIHQRSPVFLGSPDNIKQLLAFFDQFRLVTG